jgi:hypothetical protein
MESPEMAAVKVVALGTQAPALVAAMTVAVSTVETHFPECNAFHIAWLS